MVQTLKPEVRERILRAAADIFATHGFEEAKLSDIASKAGTVTSNLYKYFKNKEDLFDAIVKPSHAKELLNRLQARVKELETRDDWLSADAEGSLAAASLLDFWVNERKVVLILLRGASGTRYAHIRQSFIEEMEQLTIEFIRRKSPDAPPDEHLHFVLNRLFARTVEMLTDILDHFSQRKDIEAAFGYFWTYQLTGLQAVINPKIDGKK
ncbi:MAG: TetR/AcrR family transcriptional regulator [Sneathiellales bacterium]|nr:TetR/AcrR family transcriptional regulator [Sneathiellales bacterium]